jgi:hypothetical protein
MGSKFYGKLLPDYGDLDNKTGTAPGYRVYILENDGGLSLQMMHADENPSTGSAYSVFLNTGEADEFMFALQEAISRAKSKNVKHRNRGQDC